MEGWTLCIGVVATSHRGELALGSVRLQSKLQEVYERFLEHRCFPLRCFPVSPFRGTLQMMTSTDKAPGQIADESVQRGPRATTLQWSAMASATVALSAASTSGSRDSASLARIS